MFYRYIKVFIYITHIYTHTHTHGLSRWHLVAKNPPASTGDKRDVGSIPGQEDPLEEGMATHSSILAWRIPWTEEPGGLQSIGSQKFKHDFCTHIYI